MISRRQVVRSCRQRGWTIQPGALQGILELAETEEEVELILDQLNLKGSNVVTDGVWNELMEMETDPQPQHGFASKSAVASAVGSSRGRSNDTATAPTSDSTWSVVNAFETPKLGYEAMRRQFYVEEKQYSLFGTAQDKANMLSQRYALIHQRLMRHDFFRPTDLSRSSAKLKLVPIESLLGSTHDHPVLLLGLLLQIEEGQWYLEDPSGQIRVSFQMLSKVDDFFVAEHCVLVVEGRLHDGIFYVAHVGNPVLEQRGTSLAAIRQQVSHPAYGSSLLLAPAASSGDAGDYSSFVFLSDVHLDQPRVVQHLEALFARYEKFPPSKLPTFLLMGSFSSSREIPAPMEELAGLVATFTNLRRHGRFVLVPGPNDAPGYTLPMTNSLLQFSSSSSSRSGSSSNTAALFGRMNVEWATNPCRIRNHRTGSEIVVFRFDLLHLFQRQQLFLHRGGAAKQKKREDGDGKSMSEHDDNDNDEEANGGGDDVSRHRDVPSHVRLIKTVLGQAHLLPVSGVPVAWNYDHALRLYPLPSLVVLGGDGSGFGSEGAGKYHEVYEGCRVIHPGSAVSGSFAIYREGCADEDDDDNDAGAGPQVEFGQLGVEK